MMPTDPLGAAIERLAKVIRDADVNGDYFSGTVSTHLLAPLLADLRAAHQEQQQERTTPVGKVRLFIAQDEALEQLREALDAFDTGVGRYGKLLDLKLADAVRAVLASHAPADQKHESRSPDGDGPSMKSHARGVCAVRPVERQAPPQVGAASGEALRAGSEPADSHTTAPADQKEPSS